MDLNEDNVNFLRADLLKSEEFISYIRMGLDGKIKDEKIMERIVPVATAGVRKYGFLGYFLGQHNYNLEKSKTNNEEMNEELEKCKARLGDIVGKSDSKYVVRTTDGRELVTDSEVYDGIKMVEDRDLTAGSHVLLHTDKIRMVLNDERYKEAVDVSKNYPREKDMSEI